MIVAPTMALPGAQMGPQKRFVHGDGPPAPKGSAPLRCCSSCSMPKAAFVWTPGDILFLYCLGTGSGEWHLTTSGDTIVFFSSCCLHLFAGGMFTMVRWCTKAEYSTQRNPCRRRAVNQLRVSDFVLALFRKLLNCYFVTYQVPGRHLPVVVINVQ